MKLDELFDTGKDIAEQFFTGLRAMGFEMSDDESAEPDDGGLNDDVDDNPANFTERSGYGGWDD